MDKIGDTRVKVYVNGKSFKQTFVACIQCGKGRWQMLKRGISDRLICRSCSLSNMWKREGFKENFNLKMKQVWANPTYKQNIIDKMSGENNHFYGKKHKLSSIKLMSKPRVKVNIGRNFEWGYFMGLVLGDGCVSVNSKRNYKIAVGSTKPEIVDKFKECCDNLGLHCTR